MKKKVGKKRSSSANSKKPIVTNDIRVANLTKSFGTLRAISDVSFTIQPASITGFLGPNGSGKTTTMNILLGFIRPTFGIAKLNGHKMSPDSTAARREIGFVASNTALDNNFTVWRELKYFARLSGKKVKNDEIIYLANKLGVDLKAKIKKLSSGNRQKVALLIALLGKPKILILDEPTNGLDPLAVAEFKLILQDLRSSGTTIFISSHILSDIEDICDNFLFIRDGRIVTHKSKAELLALSPTIVTLDADKVSDIVYAVKNAYGDKVKIEIPESGGLYLTVRSGNDINPLIKSLSKHKISNLQIRPESLETVFMLFFKPDSRNDDDEIAKAYQILVQGAEDLRKAKKATAKEAKK
ncbi:ABC transporter ATP-binding protein [Candidatus Saccharibacteria bacterium]|nr:ABC transporter ATP-binding protein [Candidatus Saccharibacteria bacterium]